jgi:hypothetical protein
MVNPEPEFHEKRYNKIKRKIPKNVNPHYSIRVPTDVD